MGQREIIEYLRTQDGYRTTSEISKATGVRPNCCNKSLNQLVRFGFIDIKRRKDGQHLRYYFKFIKGD